MLEIKKNQELNVVNVLSYRGKLKQSDIENIGKKMDDYINNSGAKRAGYPMTATYFVEGDILDIELIIPIDKNINSTDEFIFKNEIKIVNAVVVSYKGHPIGLQDACNQLNQYISENNLQPITVGYNVSKKMDMFNPENTEIDVYVGISPNIL